MRLLKRRCITVRIGDQPTQKRRARGGFRLGFRFDAGRRAVGFGRAANPI